MTPGPVPEGLCPLPCGESGSTLRFLLPVTGALGARAVFQMEGRLPQRPLEPLRSLLEEHGMEIRQEGDRLFCSGNLTPGTFRIPGNVSSQYVSGLLMALPLLPGDSVLEVTGEVESAAYISMTLEALAAAGAAPRREENTFYVRGGTPFTLPRQAAVEGDYSSAAFFLCMGAFSREGITVTGLAPDSVQGDRAVTEILRRFGAKVSVQGDAVTVRRGELRGVEADASPIPDLIPVLAAVAAGAEGVTRFYNAGRLRLKESDRIASTAAMLRSLGGRCEERESELIVFGGPLSGGETDPWGDHRIAMAAAAAACACRGPVTVRGAQCVAKSYPRFWEDLEGLKGEEP